VLLFPLPDYSCFQNDRPIRDYSHGGHWTDSGPYEPRVWNSGERQWAVVQFTPACSHLISWLDFNSRPRLSNNTCIFGIMAYRYEYSCNESSCRNVTLSRFHIDSVKRTPTDGLWTNCCPKSLAHLVWLLLSRLAVTLLTVVFISIVIKRKLTGGLWTNCCPKSLAHLVWLLSRLCCPKSLAHLVWLLSRLAITLLTAVFILSLSTSL